MNKKHYRYRMKKKKYNMCLVYIKTIIICFFVFMFQSCENTDMPETECIKKKVSIYFEGNTEGVFPWVSFVAYTENHTPLNLIQDGDTVRNNDGTFSISRGEIPLSGKVVLYSNLKNAAEWIYLGVTYRKRMKNPSEADELKIRIQGYVNDIQYLDTMHVMPAFRSDEEIDEVDYIYKLKF